MILCQEQYIDTNCCIVGFVEKVMYGMKLTQINDVTTSLLKEYIKILTKVYKSIN